jgi:hypothetical protein
MSDPRRSGSAGGDGGDDGARDGHRDHVRRTPSRGTGRSVEGTGSAAPRDWRAATLARIRALITEADPDVVEEVKWRKPSNPEGVPVWSHDGLVCTGETYKDHVKVTFAKGAHLEDPHRIFNASLDGNLRRAVDLRAGDELDAEAFVELVRAAVALNGAARRRP